MDSTDLGSSVYYIEVSAGSYLKYLFYFSFALFTLLVIWSWPYYLPNTVRLLLSWLFLLAFIWFLWRDLQQASRFTLSLSAKGRLVNYQQGIKAGWLLGLSVHYLGCFVLIYRQDVSDKLAKLVIYADQLNDVDRRRINRVIHQVQYQG